jgi:outer membrane protein
MGTVIVFLFPGIAPAAPDAPQSSSQVPIWDFNVGAGAAFRPTFMGSDRYRAGPLPVLTASWRDTISLNQDGISLYWHPFNFRMGGGVTYDGGRLDHETNGVVPGGDDRLRGLGDVDGSVGLRGFASYRFGPIDFDASGTRYFGRDNNGIFVNFGASSTVMLSPKWLLRPHVRLTWADTNYTETYFGITNVQAARSMFHQFEAGSGIEGINGGFNIGYSFNSHWYMGADASITQYMDDAAASPITIADTSGTVVMIVGYHFH